MEVNNVEKYKEAIKNWPLEYKNDLKHISDYDDIRTFSYIKSIFGGKEIELENYVKFIFSEFDNKFRTFLRHYVADTDFVHTSGRDNCILLEYVRFNIKLDSDMVDFIIKDNEKSKEAYKLITNGNFIRLTYINTLLCIIYNTSKDKELLDSLLMLVEDIPEETKLPIVHDYKLTYLVENLQG